MRSRLQRLADRIESCAGSSGYRVYADSAPVMEVDIACSAGLGWRGKHTLLLSRDAGSYFFLGEIYTDQLTPAGGEVEVALVEREISSRIEAHGPQLRSGSGRGIDGVQPVAAIPGAV